MTLAIALTLTAWLAFAGPLRAARIEGVVLSENGAVADASVTAYPDYQSLQAKTNGTQAKPGEKTGQYVLDLPDGKYYLVASGTQNGQPLSAYHGLNPIQAGAASVWIPLFALPETSPQCDSGFQGIGGTITYKGRPVPLASISVYTVESEPFRGMGLLTSTVQDNGAFWFDLEPGRYVLMARKRQAEGAIGPLRKGDLFCAPSSNPIQVLPGRACQVAVPCYPRDDIDAFFAKDASDPRGDKAEARRTASLRELDELQASRGGAAASRSAVVSGRVTDLSGRALAGLYVTAYPASEHPLFQMYILRFKTNFMTRTDSQGFYRLELTGGPYYLVAREQVGDAPTAGEHYGLFEGSPNHSLTVAAGEVRTNIHLVAEPIMPESDPPLPPLAR